MLITASKLKKWEACAEAVELFEKHETEIDAEALFRKLRQEKYIGIIRAAGFNPDVWADWLRSHIPKEWISFSVVCPLCELGAQYINPRKALCRCCGINKIGIEHVRSDWYVYT